MNDTNHPARRLRHGDRPTEPLTFEDAAANKAAEEGDRERFEAWYTPKFGKPKMLGSSDQYYSPSAQGAWQAWQGRSKVAAQAGQVAVPEGLDPRWDDNGEPWNEAAEEIDRKAGSTMQAAPSPAKESK